MTVVLVAGLVVATWVLAFGGTSSRVLQAIAFAVGFEDMAVVRQPVWDGAGQPLVAEHLGPLPEGQIRCHDDAGRLVQLPDGVSEKDRGPESASDHAAKWETSNVMLFYFDLVDMSEPGHGPINVDMRSPSGIDGLDPRDHASAEVGRRNVELAAEAVGRKARELLASLPEDKLSFNLEAVSPGNWWLI